MNYESINSLNRNDSLQQIESKNSVNISGYIEKESRNGSKGQIEANSKKEQSIKKPLKSNRCLSPPPEGKKYKLFEMNPYKISNRHIFNLSSFNDLQVKIFDFLYDTSKHLVKYNKDFALIQKYRHYIVNKDWAAVKISEFNLVILMKILQYPTIIIDNTEIISLIKWLCIKNIHNYFDKILKKNSEGLNEQALIEDNTFFNYLNINSKTKCILNLIKYSRSLNKVKRNYDNLYYLTSIKYTNAIVVKEYRIFISILVNALHYANNHKKTEIKTILEKDKKISDALKFYNAVNDNEFETIKNLFKNITYFDVMNTEGLNPILLSIKKGHTSISKFLINTKEYDVNDKDKNGTSPLIQAVLQENEAIVDLLLENSNIRVNLKDKNGNSAFFYAVKSYNKTFIEKFLEYPGVNINTKNNNKLTPCILTVSFIDKYFNISKFFLTNEKVDINAYDRYGNCALIIAMIKGKVKIVDLLLQQERLLINNKNKNGKTVLRQIIEDNNSFFTKKLLTRKDIDINVPGPDGRPVIFTAIQYKGLEILKLLLNQDNIDINYQDPDGFSPLMVAVQCQNDSIINTLLKLKNLKINLQNSRGRTALRIAVDIRNIKIVKKLLQVKDIDIDIPDIYGEKISDVIKRDDYQNTNIKKLILNKLKI
ncbi:ankyrin [Piromyces finnis]|uniref:Ankyrin n=1 Tax=Piromyces finnis TaxID=1754191 RepID=A0A1Y1V9M7_9FUNG|nr:ankyrin [Piromyces finnis]|eukprot:ORX50410.1 ankyrin [Piromyces finnis]